MKPVELPADVVERTAVVYVRQSSMAQVFGNLESQRRQYDLARVAREYGFRSVEVIDDDQGVTAGGTADRPGFQKLVAMVCAGSVGAVLSIEASRLARNGRDWHHLVELCGLVGTRVIDIEGVYDPSNPNDRMVLGFKGTMSEFELNTMRRRLTDAKMTKAIRGELRLTAPVGYVWLADGKRFEMDPNRRVQDAVRLVFTRFQELGTIHKVVRSMSLEGLTFPSPVNGKDTRNLAWRAPCLRTMMQMLRNPFYAGVYAFGKTRTRVKLVDGRARKTREARPSSADWPVFIPNHHAAYITMEDFTRNRARVAQNHFSKKAGSPKSARGGRALLTGLVRCGRCGRMAQVAYTGKLRSCIRYICHGDKRSLPQVCLSLGGLRADPLVAAQVLKVVQPLVVEAAVKAEQLAHVKQDAARRAIELELEQARYEARLAARRYEGVDPDNRLVADELEARWNAALVRVKDVERRLAAPMPGEGPLPDREALLALAEDIDAVWNAADSDMSKKQRILRVLIREIVANVDIATQEIVLVIHWVGGAHSEHRVKKPVSGENSKQASPETVEIVRSMATRFDNEAIATTLNRMGILTGQGNTWTAVRVRHLRATHDIRAYESANKGGDWLTEVEAADRLGVTRYAMRKLRLDGVVPGYQVLRCAPWQIRVADLEAPTVQEAVKRLSEGPCRAPTENNNPLFSSLSPRDSE